MSTYLYRLGRFAYLHRWRVVAAWLVLLVLSAFGSATLGGTTRDAFELPGTESVEALELLAERFPEMGSTGATARVVFAAPPGATLTDPAYAGAISATVANLAEVPGVERVPDPFQARTVSPDATVAFADVTYGDEWPKDALAALQEAAAPARDAGLTVEFSGPAVQEELSTDLGAELIGLGVAAVVLVLTFGSLLAAGMPLLNAVIGVGTAAGAVAVASRFVELGTATPILATMLGLALAIDYSLFIVSRYRHELAVGHEGPEAAGRAVATAGSAVVFAGLTVMVALFGLSVVGIPMLTEMGLAAAFAVAVSVLIALTMLPALCGLAGRRIRPARVSDPRLTDGDGVGRRRGPAARWASLVTRRPVPVLLVVGLALVGLALPAADLRLGLPDEGSMPQDTTQRRAYDLIARGFGPGFNGPLSVVVDTAGVADPQAAAATVAATVAELDNVAAVLPPTISPAGDVAVLVVLPVTGPAASETTALVEAIRDRAGELADATGARVAVTGLTAIMIDFNDRMGGALLPYLALISGLSFLLLMLVFRSVLVPLKAALGFLLTTGATFGLVVAVFQWGWLEGLGVHATGLVVSFLPVILVGIVFGLAMDYQVFIATRMREEYVHGLAPVEAVVTGFRHGARVVTAAAVIMISVFGAFAFSTDEFIMQIALALAVAIALDAFVVRMTLVPAALALLGRAAWWLPRWLDRLLPNVDVEGARLVRTAVPERELVGAAR